MKTKIYSRIFIFNNYNKVIQYYLIIKTKKSERDIFMDAVGAKLQYKAKEQ